MAFAVRVEKDPVFRNDQWTGCGIYLLGLLAGAGMDPREAVAKVADLRRRLSPEIWSFELPDGRTVRCWREN